MPNIKLGCAEGLDSTALLDQACWSCIHNLACQFRVAAGFLSFLEQLRVKGFVLTCKNKASAW